MAATQIYRRGSDGLWHGAGRPDLDTFVVDETEPDASNTGYVVLGYTSETLTDLPSGDYALATQADADALAGKRVHGAVKFTGSNITLQGCEIVGRAGATYDASYRGLISNASGTGNVVQFCEISQWDASTSTDNSVFWREGFYLTGGTLTFHRNNVHDVNHLGYVTGGTITETGNYMHDPSFRTDDTDHASDATHPNWSHNDGTHLRGGSNHSVHGNTFEMKFSTNTGMNSTANPDPEAEQVWPNCHGHLLQAANSNLSGTQIKKNWYRYGAVCFHFTTNTVTPGSAPTITGNRITPNQGKEFGVYTQIRIDPTTDWATITVDSSNVYSDDSDTPLAWRGVALKAPTTAGTVKVWQYNSGAHTP
jgi:hypothetical protein